MWRLETPVNCFRFLSKTKWTTLLLKDFFAQVMLWLLHLSAMSKEMEFSKHKCAQKTSYSFLICRPLKIKGRSWFQSDLLPASDSCYYRVSLSCILEKIFLSDFHNFIHLAFAQSHTDLPSTTLKTWQITVLLARRSFCIWANFLFRLEERQSCSYLYVKACSLIYLSAFISWVWLDIPCCSCRCCCCCWFIMYWNTIKRKNKNEVNFCCNLK